MPRHPLGGALRVSEEPPTTAFYAGVERLCPHCVQRSNRPCGIKCKRICRLSKSSLRGDRLRRHRRRESGPSIPTRPSKTRDGRGDIRVYRRKASAFLEAISNPPAYIEILPKTITLHRLSVPSGSSRVSEPVVLPGRISAGFRRAAPIYRRSVNQSDGDRATWGDRGGRARLLEPIRGLGSSSEPRVSTMCCMLG
jgi:hypothetical protein